jgi:ribonucleoside-diphosphate reductase alpha chain
MAGGQASEPRPAKSERSKPAANGMSNGASNGAAKSNGHHPAQTVEEQRSLLERAGVAPKLNPGSARSDQFATFQVDAPSCDNCGAITVRNGNCYLCHNCGNSMGCS